MRRSLLGISISKSAVAVILASAAFSPLRAQDPGAADDMKRGVARISVMDGQVSVRRGDAGEWVAGVVNAPLMADDSVSTAPNSRGEVQFDSSNMIRIGGNAEIHLTALEFNRVQMELARGTVTFRVLRPSTSNIEVDTPSVSVRPSKVGVYRISVNDAGETQVAVRSGDVEVFTPKGSQWISSGQMLLARGSASDPEFQSVAAIPYDEWDRWNDSRDQALTQASASASYQNVPPGVYGAEDLGNYGTWTDVPTYGNVWRPTVAVGWSPYSSGRWVWEDWYGWTWVSADPWGWAPYHYGRWFHEANYGWCWYPGVRGIHHYWSPALVGFFGFGGGGIGVGFGFGHVGWVPLAPFEVFHPWWGRGFYGEGSGNRVNITNVNIYNNYRNARVLNGVSGVRSEDFRGGNFGSTIHPGREQLGSAGLVRGQMPIGPSGRSNLQFSDRQAAFTPRTGGASHFFTHQQTPAVEHMAVTRQFAGASQGQGTARPAMGSTGSINNDRPAAAARTGQNGGGGGWRSFGEASGQAAGHGAAQAAGPRGENGVSRSGQSFGGQNGGQAPSIQSGGQRGQAPATQNAQPSQAPSGGGWNRFGDPGARTGRQFGTPSASQQSAPQSRGQQMNQAPRNYSAPQQYGGGQQRSMGIAPPVVHERPSSNAPSYNAPRSTAPSYSAPRSSAPSYSAPRSSGGGSAPASRPSGGGGGGGRPSGGGGHSGGGGRR